MVYTINPLQDPRWPEFVSHHPSASVFHTADWLEALRRTYGYEPVAFTISAPGGELRNSVVFCQIRSRITGRRLVSLPFSDHCQPLVETPAELEATLEFLQGSAEKWKYIEMRPLADEALRSLGTRFNPSASFGIYKIDLRPDQQVIFNNFHEDCVQRKICKAEREQLTCEAGRSGTLLRKFYSLLLLTRRRHQLPPQPLAWFRNLIECLGEKLTIHVAFHNEAPVASIMTLLHKQTLVYKYGCSDAKFHNLGGMPFLFWKAIQQGKQAGTTEFDLGRCAEDEPGVALFKERLGASRTELNYYRYPISSPRSRLRMPWAQQIFAHMPDAVLTGAGRLLYKHLG